MKRILVILLMLAYSLSSSGVTISLHYCCGKLDNISFIKVSTRTCNMGSCLKKTGCCNDKQISAKVIQEQEQVIKSVLISKYSIVTPPGSYHYSHPQDTLITSDRLARVTPLLLPSIPLFIRNCTFRI
jgi:hypothetical protein